jgi:hypothetical protein
VPRLPDNVTCQPVLQHDAVHTHDHMITMCTLQSSVLMLCILGIPFSQQPLMTKAMPAVRSGFHTLKWAPLWVWYSGGISRSITEFDSLGRKGALRPPTSATAASLPGE